MPRDILFATDGSPNAEQAQEWIINNLDPDEDVVHVLSVGDINVEHLTQTMVYNEEDDIRKQVRPEAEEIAGEAENVLSENGFSVDTRVKVGNPGEAIVESARELSVNEIIMGRRGRGAMAEVLLGSVSQFVIHHSPCAVTIIPPEED